MKTIHLILIFIILSQLGTLQWADKPDEPQNQTEEQAAQALAAKCKNRIVASPFVFYTPETSVAFGAAGSYVFRLAGCESKTTRPSSLSPVFIYTLKKQMKLQLSTDLYFKDNDYHVKGEIKYEKFPFKFYGIGNNTPETNEEVYTPQNISFFVTVLKNLGSGFSAGLQYRLLNWKMLEVKADGLLSSRQIPGSEKGTLSGFSFIVNHDTRDNIYFPSRGDFSELNVRVHPKFMGSTFQYTSLTLDLRQYIPVFSSHVLAAQFLLQTQTGDVPFVELSRFGGEYLMRGYYNGRYRDKNLMAMQAEYRMPLFGRFGVVGFAGLANVAEKINQFDFTAIKSSYGFGLRFQFDKKENIWLRLDVAFGQGSSGFYVTVFEAF